MKAVIQRCLSANVVVDGCVVGSIGQGLTVFLGIMDCDGEAQAEKLVHKLISLRIFSDKDGKFNDSLYDISGSVLLISNFTLCADFRKGSRPSFSAAASPMHANKLYEHFAKLLKEGLIPVETGIFSANMQVNVENDGPVAIILEVN